jgi:hypothetical protein
MDWPDVSLLVNIPDEEILHPDTPDKLTFRPPYFANPYPLQKHFQGREQERKQLSDWLLHGDESLFALVAIGGMGKSALAWVWLLHDVLGEDIPSSAPGQMPSITKETANPGALCKSTRGRDWFCGKIFTKSSYFYLWERDLLVADVSTCPLWMPSGYFTGRPKGQMIYGFGFTSPSHNTILINSTSSLTKLI